MKSKKINFLHYILFVYCFFPFTFKPFRMFQVALAYGGAFIYVLFNLNYLVSKIRDSLVFNSLHSFLALIILLLLRPLFTLDYTYLNYFISFMRAAILILCMVIILLKKNIKSFEEIANVYINVMIIYICFSIAFLLPPLRMFWTSIIYATDRASELIESVVYYTRFGLQGFSGWGHTVHCALAVTLFWVLKLNETKISYFKLLLLLTGCAFYGRSGLIVALISSFLASLCAIRYRKIKLILFIFSLGLILFFSLLIYMKYFSSEYNALSWMFEPFVNKLKGKDASSSSNALKGMYQRFHIDNARSLVFGDGLYTDADRKSVV